MVMQGRQFMKKLLYTSIILLGTIYFAWPVEAATYSSIDIGKPSEPNDWLQGVEVSPTGIYVMDGTTIKRINGKKIETIFDVKNLSKVLSKDLKLPNISDTFLLTQMYDDGGRLYVSGLVYKNVEEEKRISDGSLVAGETHTVVFSVKDKKPHLIHTNLSYQNKAYQFGDYYETPTELPDNMFVSDYGILVAFGRYVNKPRFTMTKNHELVFAAQREGEGMSLFTDIYQYKASKKELLYTLETQDEEYTIPTLKNGQLTIYYEINNQYDDYNIRTIQLNNKKEKGMMVPEELLLERPLEINNQMYFLNDEGIYKVWQDSKSMNVKWILRASDLPLSVWISGWDYDGKYVYITDFDQRQVLKIKP